MAGKTLNGSAYIFPWQRCQTPIALPSTKTQKRCRGPMGNTRYDRLALMCAASVLALTAGARAQQTGNVEQVTVTGSRVISDITLSPTPLTVVTAEQLQATTPTNIPDALNKLPDFI